MSLEQEISKLLEQHRERTMDVSRSNFGDMLWDFERNYLYKKAIEKTIRDLLKSWRADPPDDSSSSGPKRWHFMDIGTGTGLLSLFAARAVKDCIQELKNRDPNRPIEEVKISAIEELKATAECATRIFKLNNHDDMVNVIGRHSTQVLYNQTVLQRRADLLFAELYDTELIGEGALFAYQHARAEQLWSNAPMVPCRARMYIQVVASDRWAGMHKLKRHILRVPFGFPIQELVVNPPAGKRNCPGLLRMYETQVNQITDVRFISQVAQVFEFDFTRDMAKQMKRQKYIQLKSLIKPNELVNKSFAVVCWWETDLDMDGEYKLSTAPYWARHNVDYGKLMQPIEGEIVYEGENLTLNETWSGDAPHHNVCVSKYFETLKSLNNYLKRFAGLPRQTYNDKLQRMFERVSQKLAWRDHWMQAVHLLPDVIQRPRFDDDELIELIGGHDEYEFGFRVPTESECESGRSKMARYEEKHNIELDRSCGIEMGDFQRYAVCRCSPHPKMMANRNRMLGSRSFFQESIELIRDHFPRQSVIESVLVHSAAHYLPVILAEMFPSAKVYVYAGVQPNSYDFFESLANQNGLKDRIVIWKDMKHLDSLKQPIDAVMADPYVNMKAIELDSLVTFWKHLDRVRSHRLTLGRADRLLLLPPKCSIKFALVTFDHLWKLHAPVERIDGFDLTPYSSMIERSVKKTDDQVDHYMLSEYTAVCVLERTFTLYEFDLHRAHKAADRKKFEFALDVRKIERDFARKYGINQFNMYEQPLNGLHVPVREFTNLALLFWTEFDGLPTTGPIKPLEYLEPVHCNSLYYQGVAFLTEYNMNKIGSKKRPKYEFDLTFDIDVVDKMKVTFKFNAAPSSPPQPI